MFDNLYYLVNHIPGGGSVNAVTASSPLASSGGATPNITFESDFVSSVTASPPFASSGGETPNISFVGPFTSDVEIRTKTLVGPNLILANTGFGGGDWRVKSSGAADPAGGGAYAIQSFSDGTTPFVILPTTNNTGIGEIAPTAKLHVKRGAGAGGSISDGNATVKIESDANANNVWLNVKDSFSFGTNGTYGFAVAGTLKGGVIYNVTNDFVALTNSPAGLPTVGFMVSSGGYLGLNQNSPTAPIQYVNNIYLGETYNGSGGWASNRVAQVMTDGTVRCSWQNNASFGSNFGTETNHDLRFYTNNTDRVFISNNGNVGIGTITPNSKLAVVGLPVYADNAAAIAGGLSAGDFYRTGADPDPVCVVH